MIYRKFNAPNVEYNEIDRSQYGVINDGAAVGTMTFIAGFADKGDDYDAKYSRSFPDFIRSYGYPTNEAERYFFNAVKEVFAKGGRTITSKIPYDNESKDKFAFTIYTSNGLLKEIEPEKYASLSALDPSISSYFEIKSVSNENISEEFEKTFSETFDSSGLMTMDQYDKLIVGSIKPNPNSIYIVDIERNKYSKDPNLIDLMDYETANFLGYVPVIVSPMNALYFQNMISGDVSAYNIASKFQTIVNTGKIPIESNVDDSDSENENSEGDNSQNEGEGNEGDNSDGNSEGDGSDNINEYVETDLDFQIDRNTVYSLKKDNSIASQVLLFNDEGEIEIIYESDPLTLPKDIFKVIFGETDFRFVAGEIASDAINLGLNYFRNYTSLRVITFCGKTKEEISPILSKLGLRTGCIIHCSDGDIIIGDTTSLNKRNSSNISYIQTNQVPERALLDFAYPIAASDSISETVSKTAASYFPSIKFLTEDRLNRTYLKQIGIVVFKMVSDASNDGKIAFTPVEAFIGSLDRNAKDPITKSNLFIDDIVNNQSQTINVFSNFDFSKNKELEKASTISITDQTVTSLGFFESQCLKTIDNDVLEKSLDIILSNCKDPNVVPIDIVCDAGVSNIAQYVKTNTAAIYDPELNSDEELPIINANSTSEWRKIIAKFDDFTKNVRKDCIFVADCLRSLCLVGNSKIVRKTAPRNTIANSIIPKIRYMLPPNSSYSAGYCNWFRCIDDTSQSYFWCPPSIKAVGVYLYTDRYANTWDAPAGDTRGVIDGAYDVSFNPTVEEAQSFYEQQWNYAVSYPLNGIVLEGQKTFQTDKTALDRVNVRRLCLAIKKQIREIARWFKYESITPYVLTRFRDQIVEFLQRVQLNAGISEYFVKIDEDNNTPETADRNEIHAAIAIRPIKTAEFIIINSIVVNQSADLEEVTNSVLA